MSETVSTPSCPPGSHRRQKGSSWTPGFRVSGSNPHLHDKVEFEVAQTAVDFTFEVNHRTWYPDVLGRSAYLAYRNKLLDLTRGNLGANRSLSRALSRVGALESRFDEPGSSLNCSLDRAFQLLRQCRDSGTLPFAVIARHAFIAEAFLRALMMRGVLDQGRLYAFRNSLRSVASEVGEELARVRSGELSPAEFNRRFGHLRPSSFDIRSSRYDRSPDLFKPGPMNEALRPGRGPFVPLSSERRSIDLLMREAGYQLEADQLLEYCRTAIRGREKAKLVFSRCLSDVLEIFAAWGERVGLTRDDLSFLTLADLDGSCASMQLEEISRNRWREYLEDGLARLPQLISDADDVYRVVEQRSVPNFVTTLRTRAAPARLRPRDRLVSQSLCGKIVLIESADPGYDWIFSEGIEGLITAFGGSNSHMAIRCAEMSVPAAIGVGEHVFETLAYSPRIELSCGEGSVRGIYG